MILSKKSVLSVSLFILILWGVVLSTFANPPTSPYAVSQNITDPACAPSSLNCYVANISIGDTVGNSPDQNGILYTNATGQVTTDPLFTRDSSTHNTNILQTTLVSLPSNLYTVNISKILGSNNSTVGTFTLGETITGGSSGATATFEYDAGHGTIYVTNIVGTFTSGETVTGDTSGASIQFNLILGIFSIGDTFSILDETNNFNIKGAGTITNISGDTYTILLTAGSIDGFDALYDGGSKAVGILSATPVPTGTTSVTQGFRTNTTGGSELVWLPTIGSNRTLGVNDHAVQWQAGGNTFFLPETAPTLGQSLSVMSNSGSDYTLGWGSGGPISVNGDTLYSSGLTGTANTVGYNIFLGANAGQGATGAYNSNFLGSSAGYGAYNASNSNFLGYSAGNGATNAYQSNFLGYSAGYNATYASNSNFFGQSAGNGATNASYSNFLGLNAGNGATSAYQSNFLGENAGYGATSAYNSNFLGQSAGNNATGAFFSNFLGQSAGNGAYNASNSNFFGPSAGYTAINAEGSNFFGNNAGYNATYGSYSNFFGHYAGQGATIASSSNFFGAFAGQSATNAYFSNFFGEHAGHNATNASNSNFFGEHAGLNATSASNSIFIGKEAGNGDTVNNTTNPDDFSILIGPNTKTGGFSNSIALGGYATNTATNQLMIGSTTRPIDTLVLTGSGGNTCVLDVTVASPSCSSDETLKTNITDLPTETLDKLLKVKTVSYDWKNYPKKGSQIGFLAQDLEKYFPEVVSVAPNGFKTVSYGGMTPILVEAMREMDLKITNITNPTEESSIVDKIIAKLIKADRVETKELCVDDVCVTRDQFLRILESSGQTPSKPSTERLTTTPDEAPAPDQLTCTEPQVLNEEGDTCIDPVTETPSVETATPEPPPAEEPSVPTE